MTEDKSVQRAWARLTGELRGILPETMRSHMLPLGEGEIAQPLVALHIPHTPYFRAVASIEIAGYAPIQAVFMCFGSRQKWFFDQYKIGRLYRVGDSTRWEFDDGAWTKYTSDALRMAWANWREAKKLKKRLETE